MTAGYRYPYYIPIPIPIPIPGMYRFIPTPKKLYPAICLAVLLLWTQRSSPSVHMADGLDV